MIKLNCRCLVLWYPAFEAVRLLISPMQFCSIKWKQVEENQFEMQLVKKRGIQRTTSKIDAISLLLPQKFIYCNISWYIKCLQSSGEGWRYGYNVCVKIYTNVHHPMLTIQYNPNSYSPLCTGRDFRKTIFLLYIKQMVPPYWLERRNGYYVSSQCNIRF